MLITDQVATAPCTDRIQEWFRTFKEKYRRKNSAHTYSQGGYKTAWTISLFEQLRKRLTSIRRSA